MDDFLGGRHSVYLNCVARVCCKSARHWLTVAPYQLHTDNRWMWRRPRPPGRAHCLICMQAITADTVIDYITHDDVPNIGLHI